MFVLDIVPVDKNNYDGQLGGIFGITVKIVYGNCCLPKFVLALPWASEDRLVGNHTLTNMPHVHMYACNFSKQERPLYKNAGISQ